MGRRSLRLTMVLGALITVLGGTGIFAVFTDRATGGPNSVETGERQRAADLKIAVGIAAPLGGLDCVGATGHLVAGQDDLTTPQFSATNIQPGGSLPTAYVCIGNAGAAAVSLAMSSIDLTDLDIACTGDEAEAGDTTCGEDGAGELAPLVQTEANVVECGDVSTVLIDGPSQSLATFSWVVSPIATVQPNSVTCIAIDLTFGNYDESVLQIAQSDQLTWRYAFDAEAG